MSVQPPISIGVSPRQAAERAQKLEKRSDKLDTRAQKLADNGFTGRAEKVEARSDHLEERADKIEKKLDQHRPDDVPPTSGEGNLDVIA